MASSPSDASEPCVIACLGSSSTQGKGQAFNWIAELELRLKSGPRQFVFHNFGVGGDLAYNALQRVPKLIACRPNKVVVFIGGNDALAMASSKAGRFFRFFNRLPRAPSPVWFEENLRAIVTTLRNGSSAAIALCSLPPMGEDPHSANPFQSDLNRSIGNFSAIIKKVAAEEGVNYIPLHEEFTAQIAQEPGQALTAFNFLPFYRDAFRAFVLHKSPDEIARLNGWKFHTDGVHLNRRGGLIVAGHVQIFIERN
jgi:lysophospholipase L1-like esterase